MARECIEYRLVKNDEGRLCAPSWVSEGGHFHNPNDHTYIGFIPVEQEREWYVPDTVSMLTEQEFVNRCLPINEILPIEERDHEGNVKKYNQQEAEAVLREFYNTKIA